MSFKTLHLESNNKLQSKKLMEQAIYADHLRHNLQVFR